MASASLEEDEDDESSDPHKHIMLLHPSTNDRFAMEKLYNCLLEIKTSPPEEETAHDGYVHCFLAVQSVQRSSDNLRFRLKLDWTGNDVKYEIQRLYDIPNQYQTLIINDKVVSDQQTLETFEIKPKGQIIYIFLAKKKIKYKASGIRVGDILSHVSDENMEVEGGAGAQETIPAKEYEAKDVISDGSSDDDAAAAPSTSKSRKKRRRHRKR